MKYIITYKHNININGIIRKCGDVIELSQASFNKYSNFIKPYEEPKKKEIKKVVLNDDAIGLSE